jgi:tripartite-type tricarboxylate transporter receptor subunit TctC
MGLPQVNVRGSIGLLAPAGTPKEVIERIAQATRTALSERPFQQFFVDAGMEPTLDTGPEQFRKSLAADIALWSRVVKALGIKID